MARLTNGGLSVRLDDKQVWEVPTVVPPGGYENWLWFRTLAAEKSE